MSKSVHHNGADGEGQVRVDLVRRVCLTLFDELAFGDASLLGLGKCLLSRQHGSKRQTHLLHVASLRRKGAFFDQLCNLAFQSSHTIFWVPNIDVCREEPQAANGSSFPSAEAESTRASLIGSTARSGDIRKAE